MKRERSKRTYEDELNDKMEEGAGCVVAILVAAMIFIVVFNIAKLIGG